MAVCGAGPCQWRGHNGEIKTYKWEPRKSLSGGMKMMGEGHEEGYLAGEATLWMWLTFGCHA